MTSRSSRRNTIRTEPKREQTRIYAGSSRLRCCPTVGNLAYAEAVTEALSGGGAEFPVHRISAGPEVFILTRLAESLPGKEANLNSSEWIENQCQFLERYARPSIEMQTDNDFLWLVSVSDRLAPDLVLRARKAIEPLGTLVFQQADEHSSQTFARFLASRGDPYVTIRFDSDDVIHPGFVRASRHHYDEGHVVFSFVNGVVYDLDQQIAGYWPHRSNTFLFHRGASGSNVYGLGVHTRVEHVFGDQMKVIYTDYPMWMKLTHSHNGWGDKISSADRPFFGTAVQRNFPSGHFPTVFKPGRDAIRFFSYLGFKLRSHLKGLAK